MGVDTSKASQESSTADRPSSHTSRTVSTASVRRLLLRVVLAALVVRLIVVCFVYPGFLAPGREHWEFGYEAGKIARSIVLGHGFGNPYYGGDTGPTAMLPPIFPYLLAGVMALFGIYTKASALVMLSLNSLVSALICVPIFFAARRSFGIRVARWTAWTWAFFPYAVYFSADSIWYRSLITLFVTLLLLVTLQLETSTHLWAWAGYGFLAGVAALIDPVALAALPFLGGWACYRLYQRRRNWIAPALTAAAVVFVTVAPWLIRNYRVFHRPVFLRDGFPQAFLVGNAGNSVHWWNGLKDPSGNAAEMAEFRRVGEQAYMAEKWASVFALIKSNPWGIAWRSVRRFLYMWTGYWSFNREYLQEEPFDPANIVFATPFTCLALIGLRKAFGNALRAAVPFALMLLSLPIVYYITTPHLAYRHPLDPEIVMLAMYTVCSWFPTRRAIAANM